VVFLGSHYAGESGLLQACIPQNEAIMQTYAHTETTVKFMCNIYSSCSQLPRKYILWYLIARVTVCCSRLQLQLQYLNNMQYFFFYFDSDI